MGRSIIKYISNHFGGVRNLDDLPLLSYCVVYSLGSSHFHRLLFQYQRLKSSLKPIKGLYLSIKPRYRSAMADTRVLTADGS